MPIRQEQMLEQMQEARAAHIFGTQLRDMVLNYLSLIPARYPGNPAAAEIVNGLSLAVRMLPQPDDRVTFDNERYYQRHARANANFRAIQEQKRRARGVPTQEQAIAMLHARNAIIRGGGEITQTYEQFNAQMPVPSRKRKGKPETIMPRDYDDDAPLEFETADDMPQDIIPKENLVSGLDIPAEPDDNNGLLNEEPKDDNH